MKTVKDSIVLTFAERCKNILVSNWRGALNTVKADAKGSKEDVRTSTIRYLYHKGRPYIWLPEKDMHNVDTLIDERGSFSVINNVPGGLISLLRSLNKFPSRVALVGDIARVPDEKVKRAEGILRETIELERQAVCQASYSVSGVLSTSSSTCKSRCENLEELLDPSETYLLYKFDIRSCTYIDGAGSLHEVDLYDLGSSKSYMLSSFSEKLIDGINQCQARRRALMLFCLVYMDIIARDALMLSVDHKGFDVLAKVPSISRKDGNQYGWKEFRFSFKEEAKDLESFCRLLVMMEEEALKKVQSFSGLG